MKKVILLLVIVFMAHLVPLVAYAEEKEAIDTPDLPWGKFSFMAGGFFSGINSSLRYGLSGLGVEVDLEEALGLDTNTLVFKADASWRFSDNLRHRLDFGWFGVKRESSKILKEDFEFGDYFYPAGTKATSKFNFDVIKGTYSYSYFQDDRFDLSAGFGFYVMPLRFEVSSEVGNVKEGDDLTAPLPVFGIRNTFSITPKIYLKNSVDFLYLEIDNFTGGITDIQIAAEYRAFEHVGFGLGVEAFRLKIKSEKSSDYPGVDFDGKITFNYMGVIFYVITNF